MGISICNVCMSVFALLVFNGLIEIPVSDLL